MSSLLFDLRQNYGGSNVDTGNLLQKSHAGTAILCAPKPAVGHGQPMPPPETPERSQARLSQSLVGSLLLSSGSWCAQGSVCALPGSVSPVLYYHTSACHPTTRHHSGRYHQPLHHQHEHACLPQYHTATIIHHHSMPTTTVPSPHTQPCSQHLFPAATT